VGDAHGLGWDLAYGAGCRLMEEPCTPDRIQGIRRQYLTSIWTAEGWLYVAVMLDLFSRRVVGWSMSASMTAQLVTDARSWRSGGAEACGPCSITRIAAANIALIRSSA
jgi:transposase InsO family protein